MGTTSKLTDDCVLPEFWKVCEMFPVPLTVAGVIPGPPVAIHEYVVFWTLELKVILACELEHTVSVGGVAIRSGTG